MKSLIEIIRGYREGLRDISIIEFESYIRPLILNRLKKVDKRHREDLKQDFLLKLLPFLDKSEFHFESVAYNLFTKENRKIIEQTNNYKGINELFQAPSLEYYLATSKEKIHIFLEEFGSYEKWQIFDKEYNELVVSKKLLKLIADKIDSVVHDFYKKNNGVIENEVYILNVPTESGNDLVEMIPCNREQTEEIDFENYGIEKEDITFLKLFINGDELLTQSEVAKRLNISQQAVAKRIKLIKEKY